MSITTAPEEETNRLKIKAVHSARWESVTQVGAPIIQLVVVIILSRLLSPRDFGLVNAAIIVMGYATVISELGLVAAVVQRKELLPEHLNAAFLSNFLIGSFFFAVLLFGAPVIAAWFKMPDLVNILRVIAFSALISSLSAVPRALLLRNMRFKQLASANLLSQAVYGVFAFGLAVMHQGAWSLVWATFFRGFVYGAHLWLWAGWPPPSQLSRPATRVFLTFGVFVMSSLLTYNILSSIDGLFVGRFFGATALGFYSMALQLAVRPLMGVGQVARNVLYPTLSKLQEQPKSLGDFFLDTSRYFSRVLFPAIVVALVFADGLVYLGLGTKWEPVIWPMRILLVSGLLTALDFTSPVYRALGQPRSELKNSLLRLGLVIAGLACFGIQLGVVGVATVVSVSYLLATLAALWSVTRLYGGHFTEYVRAILPEFRNAVLLGGALILLRLSLLDSVDSALLQLVLGSMSALILYLLIMVVFDREGLLQTARLLKIGLS